MGGVKGVGVGGRYIVEGEEVNEEERGGCYIRGVASSKREGGVGNNREACIGC